MRIEDCRVGSRVYINTDNPWDAGLLEGDCVEIVKVEKPNYIEVKQIDQKTGKVVEPVWAVEPSQLSFTINFTSEVEDSKWYVKNAIKTDLPDYQPVCERLQDKKTVRILHAAMGLTTEAGEVMDAIKKHLIYGKTLDLVNLKEELGDIFWYCAILADTIGIKFDEAMGINIAKLKARFGERFTEEAALNRNLDNERKILEGDSNA